MSIAYVQGAQNATFADASYRCQVTFDHSTPNPGCLIVVDIRLSNAAIVSVTDNAGNTYYQAKLQVGVAGNLYTYYASNCATVPSHTVTVVHDTGSTWDHVIIREFTGLVGTGDPFDGAAGASAAATSGAPFDFSLGAVAPTATGDLVVMNVRRGAVSCDTQPGTLSEAATYWDTFYTVLGSSAPFSANGSFSAESEYHGIAVAFKADASVWVDFPDFEVRRVDFGRYPAGAARVSCAMWAKDAGVTMKARLYDITNAASLAESAAVTSQAETDATFAVTSSGIRTVKLQLTSTPPQTDLFGAPGAEVGP